MHPSLQIPEIVGLVVSGLDPSDRADLAALARTSTIFHEPCLDALWRDQDTLMNLIRCTPDNLWETTNVDGVPTLVRSET
jgi:hypothetical protein